MRHLQGRYLWSSGPRTLRGYLRRWMHRGLIPCSYSRRVALPSCLLSPTIQRLRDPAVLEQGSCHPFRQEGDRIWDERSSLLPSSHLFRFPRCRDRDGVPAHLPAMLVAYMRALQGRSPLPFYSLHQRGRRKCGPACGAVRVEALSWMRPPRRAHHRLLPHDVQMQTPVLLPLHRAVEDLHMYSVG